MFYLDVAIIDLDVIYIYASVSGVFICILQVFHLDVCNGYTFLGVFVNVSDVCFKCFICLRMYVSNVNRVLHLPLLAFCYLVSVSHPPPLVSVQHPPPLPFFSMLVTFGHRLRMDVQNGVGNRLHMRACAE
jgi:hypothetical protein